MDRQDQLQALSNVQSGTTGTQGDKVNRTLWDEEILAATPLTTRLFQNPIGAGGKLLDQTNNTQAGQIPSNRKMFVKALKIFYTSGATKAAADVAAIAAAMQELYTQLTRTTATIMINNREFGQWTIQELMGTSLLYCVTPLASAFYNQPEPRFHGIFPLNETIELAGTTQFFVEINHAVAPSLTVGDRLRFGLAGIELRIN